MDAWMRLVLAVLTTWRVTHLLASEDGPSDLMVHFRALLGNGLAGKLMDCFYCRSVWIATPAALFVTRRPLAWIMTWMATSGAACLLEKMVENRTAIDARPQLGQGETEDVLWIEANAVEEQSEAGVGAGQQAGGGDRARY